VSYDVGVVNYGMAGNTHSVIKALEKAGAKVKLLNDPESFSTVPRIILPGVGSYKEGMEELHDDGFIEAIRNYDGLVLGICVGMQVLSYLGYEHGLTKGLNLISGEVKKIECSGKVPHMGFNRLEMIGESPLLEGIENELFYFMHSYELINYTDILALTEYANHKFVSAVSTGNYMGVQFHPEKSREAGIQLFKNFIKMEKVG